MDRVIYIFTVGITGVFIIMLILYGAIRLTAMVADMLEKKGDA